MSNKLEDLEKILKEIEQGNEILEPNLEAIYNLAKENKMSPEEFMETFKKRFKDILA